MERAALAAAEADLESAKAELLRTSRGLRREDVDAAVADAEGARAKANLSRDALARTEKLAQGGAATPDEIDRARRQAEADQRALESLEAKKQAALAGSRTEDIAQARARVLGAAARRDQARAQLERLSVRAPIAGEILSLKFRAGEYYNPGGDPLVIAGDTQVLRVRLDVDERDVARVALGAPAFVTSSAFPERRSTGKVVEIAGRMGRKNLRTDDPVERIDTKILEVVLQLDERTGSCPGRGSWDSSQRRSSRDRAPREHRVAGRGCGQQAGAANGVLARQRVTLDQGTRYATRSATLDRPRKSRSVAESLSLSV